MTTLTSAAADRHEPVPRPHGERSFSLLTLAGLLILSLLLRLIAMSNLPLIPEEAYYWMYAQNPQLSYFDHPPMVAWVIKAGTWFLGDTEFGVRIGGNLLMCGVSVFLYCTGRLWFGRRVSGVAALLPHALPVYFASGLVAPMDAALMFGWALCFWATSTALVRGATWAWYVAGVAFGFALLSKYSGIALAPAVLLTLLGRREWRRHLRRPHVYLAFGIGIAMFTPVLIWNAQNDWASFRFQFVDRYAGDVLNPRTPLVLLGTQFVVLTPLLLAGVCCMVLVLRRRRRLLASRYWPAIAFAAPGIGLAINTSLRSSVHINWTVAFYLSLFPAVVHAFAVCSRSKLMWPLFRRSVSLTAAVMVGLNVGLLLFLLTVQRRLGLWEAFGPWRDLAIVVEQAEDALEAKTGREPLVIADGKYRLASVIAFYRRSLEPASEGNREAIDFTTSQWLTGGSGLGYAYWSDRGQWVGVDAIYVTDTGTPSLDDVAPFFESVRWLNTQAEGPSKRYRVAECKNFLATPRPRATHVVPIGRG